MTSIVLAGGKSLRLGREKALEKLDGQSLVERVITRLSRLGGQIILVTATEEQALLPHLKVKRVLDVLPGKGALGGLYSGLKAASTHYCLVVACDMPFLNVALLQYLMKLSPGFDAVIPRLGGRLQPLHAIYSKDCLGPIEAMLEECNIKVTDLAARVKTRYVEDKDIATFDREHLSFFNINSESDLERARALLDRERALSSK